ncbi:hypothetical protein BKA62DRAFT_795838 [Auriculariales sp. MPI-PUGE-AT-0066]|nr:hypothetical protein BKA62DRAFT_795838 [Auriculariales sp. MPI-PUGE-AT-0066]
MLRLAARAAVLATRTSPPSVSPAPVLARVLQQRWASGSAASGSAAPAATAPSALRSDAQELALGGESEEALEDGEAIPESTFAKQNAIRDIDLSTLNDAEQHALFTQLRETEGKKMTDKFAAGRVAHKRKTATLDEALAYYQLAPKTMPTAVEDINNVVIAFLKSDIYRIGDIDKIFSAIGVEGPSKYHRPEVWTRAAQNAFRYAKGDTRVWTKADIGEAFATVKRAVNEFKIYAANRHERQGEGRLYPPMVLLMLLASNPIIPQRHQLIEKLLVAQEKYGSPKVRRPQHNELMSHGDFELLRCKNFDEILPTMRKWDKGGKLQAKRMKLYLRRISCMAFDQQYILPLDIFATLNERHIRLAWVLYPEFLSKAIHSMRRPLSPMYLAYYDPKDPVQYEAAVRKQMGDFAQRFEDEFLSQKSSWQGYIRIVTLFEIAGRLEDKKRVVLKMKELFPERQWDNLLTTSNAPSGAQASNAPSASTLKLVTSSGSSGAAARKPEQTLNSAAIPLASTPAPSPA